MEMNSIANHLRGFLHFHLFGEHYKGPRKHSPCKCYAHQTTHTLTQVPPFSFVDRFCKGDTVYEMEVPCLIQMKCIKAVCWVWRFTGVIGEKCRFYLFIIFICRWQVVQEDNNYFLSEYLAQFADKLPSDGESEDQNTSMVINTMLVTSECT